MQLTRPSPDAKIAFLSPSGWGNLGDAAIIESLIEGIRARVPRARIAGFTQNPAYTAQQHRVESHSCLGYSLPHYGVRELDETGGDANAGPARYNGLKSRVARVARSIVRGPLLRRLPRMWSRAPILLLRERAHLRRSREWLRGASMLVVAGGGQLDDSYGGSFGHPYVLWRWGRLARAVGARFIFASVGTGNLSWASRRFVLSALKLAAYRSFRDEGSRVMLRAPAITREDRIVPDLAYALPVRPVAPPRGERLVFGLSPMNYGHPKHWPRPDQRRYEQHVRSFGSLGARAIADGHRVVLFVTAADSEAARDASRFAIASGAHPERISIAPTGTVDGLFEVLAGVDLVVAARLHGVILAHLAHRPALAVSHERKVFAVMADMGQTRFCFDIESFEADAGYERLKLLVTERDSVTNQIASTVAEYRRRVLAQYDLILGPELPRPAGD